MVHTQGERDAQGEERAHGVWEGVRVFPAPFFWRSFGPALLEDNPFIKEKKTYCMPFFGFSYMTGGRAGGRG
jgi:hypothetical protein